MTKIFSIRVRKLCYLFLHPTSLVRYIRFRTMPSIEHEPVLVSSLKTVIDVGANRGQFALAANIFTGASIYSFEPLPGPADVFRKIFKGFKNVSLYEYGIGEIEEKRKINISNSDDSSSFLSIGEHQKRLFPGTEANSSLQVNVAPLEQFLSDVVIQSPSLLKIDVQGFEKSVLISAGEALATFDYIYCECSFVELYNGQPLCHEIIAFLDKKNYILNGVFNVYYDKKGRSIQADFLFVNRLKCQH